MCMINCEIVEGLIPSEKVAKIQIADGSIEEVAVAPQQIIGNKMQASEVGRTGDKVLVELPRETASGRWRVWLNIKQIGE